MLTLPELISCCHFFLSGHRAVYEQETQGAGHRVSGKMTHPGKVPAGDMVGSDHAQHHWYVWAPPALAREKLYLDAEEWW